MEEWMKDNKCVLLGLCETGLNGDEYVQGSYGPWKVFALKFKKDFPGL